MKSAFLSRRLHKWLALLVGAQALLWMASGLYMTAISIDVIHGDHLAHRDETPLAVAALAAAPVRLDDHFQGVTGFRIKRLLGREVYEVRHAGGTGLLDPRSGKRLDPVDEATVRALARDAYQGEGEIRKVTLLTSLPREVGPRKPPLWRVDYNDFASSTLYFSPGSGELVTTRHDFWRAFDFLWMLHIMDYEEREDVNNILLRVAAGGGTLFGLSGIWLLWFSLRRRARP